MECGACGGTVEILAGQVGYCVDCSGINGTCYRGEASRWVRLTHTSVEAPLEDWQYFDLVLLGSGAGSGDRHHADAQRVHGWMDRRSRQVIQWG